jgi:PIN domain nuclease of toxin-antitoxin system
MKVLLDTRTFLWWVSAGGRLLSRTARDLLAMPETEALVSATSAYEIGVKATLGKLHLPAPPEVYVPDRMVRHRFDGLAIDVRHCLRAAALPLIHRDPWDRLLIAQAQIEDLPIVTMDPLIAQYDVETIW